MSQFVARGAVPNKNQKALNDSCSGVPAETRGPATVEEISADDCLISVNDNYIIVSKPPDVRMDGDFDVTLQKMLLHWIPGSSVASLKWVHQLDYATSGILCVARTKKAAGLAGISFQTRETSKEYLAIIEGHIDPKKCACDVGRGSGSGSIYRTTRSGDDDEACLIIDIPVAEVPGQFRCQVGNTHNPGLRSRTRLRVLQHGYYQDQPVSKVVLEPHTGRRHQLRVHCWALGHPIVGDFTYGPPRAAQAERMMLHASRLRIAVPERERRYLTQRWNELGLTEESESIVSAQAPDLLVHLDGVHP
eukprot:GSChrysophyteH1.ASY1.ANO1.2622.1 assembled CDS